MSSLNSNASTVTRSQSNRAALGCAGQKIDIMYKSDESADCGPTSQEYFQHLVESLPWRINAVLKAKGV